MPKPLELRELPKLLRLLERLSPDLKPLEEDVLELELGMLLLVFMVELLLSRLWKPGEEEVFLT